MVIDLKDAEAQDYAVKPWNIMINPSLSFGHVGGYYSPYNYGVGYSPGYGFTPNFMISAKLTFHDYISAGPYLGYTWSTSNSYYTAAADDRVTTTAFGAKGTFHYWNMLDKLITEVDFRSDEFDLYANVYIGARIETVTYTQEVTKQGKPDRYVKETDAKEEPIFQPNLGARWFASDFFGLFAEFGWSGMGYFKAGATFKFN
ncbi:MAG: hypothetical protein BRD50_05740 [Bacteroidetes bacterium SW_11_45_7]|nr:MAG: hypothetical protein BRD50_05740 [Bacteroidetes bacterium SW_11_45_7]